MSKQKKKTTTNSVGQLKKKTKPIKAKRLGWENGFGKYWPTVQYANGFERILHTNCTPLISQLNHK